MRLYQISINLNKFGLCDQICPKNMNAKNFAKINIKIEISTYQSTSVPNFSQVEELQILGPSLPQKYE